MHGVGQVRFKRHLSEEFGLQQIDIAPLIDIVFQLLIFFMLTSGFIVQPGIRIDLPAAVSSENLGRERFTLVVSSEDLLYLNGKFITDTDLKKLLSSNKTRIKSVFIKGDKKASLGRVVRIWDICKSAGIEAVNVATASEQN